MAPFQTLIRTYFIPDAVFPVAGGILFSIPGTVYLIEVEFLKIKYGVPEIWSSFCGN